jgi:hypothetical protein
MAATNADRAVLELHVGERKQLFDAMDPAPFRERDLDPNAEEYIGGWVALWRPLEIFLYEWWPIRAEACLYDRLGEMDVQVLDAAVARPVP